jgi:hypothetical protein
MKTYKDDGVASDDISNGQSPDKFHEGDQYARRENGHWRARVSRDSSLMPTGCHCKRTEERRCHLGCNRLRIAELRGDGIVPIMKKTM